MAMSELIYREAVAALRVLLLARDPDEYEVCQAVSDVLYSYYVWRN